MHGVLLLHHMHHYSPLLLKVERKEPRLTGRWDRQALQRSSHVGFLSELVIAPVGGGGCFRLRLGLAQNGN